MSENKLEGRQAGREGEGGWGEKDEEGSREGGWGWWVRKAGVRVGEGTVVAGRRWVKVSG